MWVLSRSSAIFLLLGQQFQLLSSCTAIQHWRHQCWVDIVCQPRRLKDGKLDVRLGTSGCLCHFALHMEAVSSLMLPRSTSTYSPATGF